eukprot:12884987-Prorocentrum_lima.AAC.1
MPQEGIGRTLILLCLPTSFVGQALLQERIQKNWIHIHGIVSLYSCTRQQLWLTGSQVDDRTGRGQQSATMRT